MPAIRGAAILWDDVVVPAAGAGGTKATFLFTSTGDDNDIRITAKAVGVDGNDIGFRFDTRPGAGSAGCDTLGLTPPQFRVWLANDGSTTADEVVASIGANTDADPLVTATLLPDSSGDGFPTNQAFTNLEGGSAVEPSHDASIGPMTAVAIFIEVDGACEFKIQAGASKVLSSGRNALAGADWFDYMRAQALEEGVGVQTGLSTIEFAGAGAAAIDLSPFAPSYLRLVRTDAGDDVAITAYTVAVG